MENQWCMARKGSNGWWLWRPGHVGLYEPVEPGLAMVINMKGYKHLLDFDGGEAAREWRRRMVC